MLNIIDYNFMQSVEQSVPVSVLTFRKSDVMYFHLKYSFLFPMMNDNQGYNHNYKNGKQFCLNTQKTK